MNHVLLALLSLLLYLPKFKFHHYSICDMLGSCFYCIKVANCCRMFTKIIELILVFYIPPILLLEKKKRIGWCCLNQYHQLFPGTPIQNCVGLVWMIFATFSFSHCMLIDRPIFHIARIQVTIITSSYDVSTPFTLIFFVHVLPLNG
jgi:hypothetical protein